MTFEKKHNMKVKIIRMPAFLQRHEKLSAGINASLLAPLAVGSITGYLRQNGICIDQDDLNIKVHYDNMFSDEPLKKVKEEIFFDEPRIIDYLNGSVDNEVQKEVKKIAAKTGFESYKVILFSIPDNRNSSHILISLCLAKYLKDTTNPIVIAGGIFYSMDSLGYKYTDRYIDFKIMGPGEKVLLDLLTRIFDNKGDISGFDGRMLYGDYHSLVKPDFKGLPLDMYKYKNLCGDYSSYSADLRDIIKKFDDSKLQVFPLKFIRGCPFKCIFCTSSGDNRMRAVEPLETMGYLEELQKEYGVSNFFFLSDTINFSNGYISRLCDEIIKRDLKIQWTDCARINRMNKELLEKMRKAGCVRLIYGMETASRKLLDYIEKGVDLEEMGRVLKWTHESGIWCGIEVITGLPHESEEDVNATIDFVKSYEEFIDRVYIEPFTIRDWSRLLQFPERFGIGNIRRVDAYAKGEKEMKNALDRYFVKYGFDETGGLNWDQKREQINHAFEKTCYCLDQKQFPHYEEEHFLFFLYSNFSDKKDIKKIYDKARKERFEYIDKTS